MRKFGPTFGEEVEAAGLAGLPLGWTEDGSVFGLENLTSEQAAVFNAVRSAHDPRRELTKPLNNAATVQDVAMMAGELAKAKDELAQIKADMRAFIESAVAAAVGAKS